ncbi:MAG: hypothetical protein J0I06_17960 [Planctomycetes bacterium]|nr:hypothetical protein [Planctomycetota bacterium]
MPLALIGFGYAALVIWWGHGVLLFLDENGRLQPPRFSNQSDASKQSQEFLSHGKAVLWFVMLGVESAAWLVIIVAFFRPIGDKTPSHPGTNDPAPAPGGLGVWLARVVGYALIVLAVISPVLYSYLFASKTISGISPLLWHGEKMVWLLVPAVVAVTCVVARLRDVEHEASGLKGLTLRERVANYFGHQRQLRLALGAFGLMLSLNVFATGALRNALAEFLDAKVKELYFPRTYRPSS